MLPNPEKRETLRSGRTLRQFGQCNGSSRSAEDLSSSKSLRQSGQWYSKIGIVAFLGLRVFIFFNH